MRRVLSKVTAEFLAQAHGEDRWKPSPEPGRSGYPHSGISLTEVAIIAISTARSSMFLVRRDVGHRLGRETIHVILVV